MNVLFDLGHPGHVHLFKNTIKALMGRGHNVLIVVRERENTVKELLEREHFDYTPLYPNARGAVGKARTMIKNDFRLLKIAKKFNTDVFVSMTSPYSAQVSAIMRKPHITFADTEDAHLILNLTVPFTDIIITEESFKYNFPRNKHIRVRTWRPLSYLHPKYFTPNEEVLKEINLKKGDTYFVVRFSAWDASHDWKIRRSYSWVDRLRFIKKLERVGKIFITSECPLPAPLEKYELHIDKSKFLDVLAFSSGYFGEGHMTAREAVSLEKPSVLISPRANIESVIMDLRNKGYIKTFKNYWELSTQNIENLLQIDVGRIREDISQMVDLNKVFIYIIENCLDSKICEIKNTLDNFKFENTITP